MPSSKSDTQLPHDAFEEKLKTSILARKRLVKASSWCGHCVFFTNIQKSHELLYERLRKLLHELERRARIGRIRCRRP